MQNLAARLALNNWHSSSKCLLDKLHWLPVQSRIQFKIPTVTYKALAHNQSSYLKSLLTPYIPVRALRSSDKSLLSGPRTNTAIGQRAFSYSAPTIWNSIPLNIRQLPSIQSFKKHIKLISLPPHKPLATAAPQIRFLNCGLNTGASK